MNQTDDRAAELTKKLSDTNAAPEPESVVTPPADAVSQLETRLEMLKQWHAETAQRLTQTQSELEAREGAVVEAQGQADALRAQAQGELDEAKEAREKLERDRGAFEKYLEGEEAALTKQRLACEEWVAAQNAAAEASAAELRERAEQDIEELKVRAAATIAQQVTTLEDERAVLAEEADRLAQVRGELDAEWDGVRRVAAAQQTLVQAWETERERLQSAQLRLVGGDADKDGSADAGGRAQAA